MKLKYYLRGLGTGILVATLILFISYSHYSSDAQVKKRAKELGMVEKEEVITDKYPVATTEPDTTLDDKVKETSKEKYDSKDKEETTKKKKDKDTTSNNDQTNDVETTVSVETTVNDETIVNNNKTEYEFSIVAGMDSEKVAALLKNMGAIENDTDFNKYLIDNGYANHIKAGTFKITNESTYLDIALLITN